MKRAAISADHGIEVPVFCQYSQNMDFLFFVFKLFFIEFRLQQRWLEVKAALCCEHIQPRERTRGLSASLSKLFPADGPLTVTLFILNLPH